MVIPFGATPSDKGRGIRCEIRNNNSTTAAIAKRPMGAIMARPSVSQAPPIISLLSNGTPPAFAVGNPKRSAPAKSPRLRQ
jgi:hypothetical protein